MNGATGPTPQRIAEITLDERTVIRRSRAIEDERAAAITDLLKDNQFTPVSGRPGPFHLHLAVEENRCGECFVRERHTRPKAGGDYDGDKECFIAQPH